jgi:glycosyltransferase involved in cell wall biosynthesis
MRAVRISRAEANQNKPRVFRAAHTRQAYVENKNVIKRRQDAISFPTATMERPKAAGNHPHLRNAKQRGRERACERLRNAKMMGRIDSGPLPFPGMELAHVSARSRVMRIVQIVQKFEPGGLETIAATLQRHWGACVATISLEGEADALLREWPAMADLRGALFALNKQPGVDLSCLAALTRLLRRIKPDAVVTHHIGPMLYGGLAGRLAGVPVRAHVEHDAWHLEAPGQNRLFAAGLRLGAPRLAAVSDLVARKLATRSGRTVARVINGVDLERFKPADSASARQRLGLPQHSPIIGLVARLQKVKGADVLINAPSFLKTPACLVIVGDGPERTALELQARGRRLMDRIRFLGVRGDVEAILPALDLFVLPSRAEGLPLALVEAQACGAPVVATDVGGAREACCPKSALLAPPDDPQALAAAIDAQLAREKTSEPRAFAQSFSLAAMIASYETFTGLKS